MSETGSEPPARLSPLVVGATFTSNPLEEPFHFWNGLLRSDRTISFAPYGQLLQALQDPAGPFGANGGGVNVALFRIEDLAPHGNAGQIEQHARELVDLLAGAASGFAASLIVCLCPASPEFLETAEHQALQERWQAQLIERLGGTANLYLVRSDRVIARYEVTEVDDRVADRTGHIPYHREFFAALGTEIIRTVTALERKPLKVIAFDCDNTLWTGVCGEDGPEGVTIDAGRRALQKMLLGQKKAGVLLAIVSKNNEADVRETFAVHPEMAVRWEDIVAYRINWEPKAANLLALSEELNLGVDSFALVDDDAKECAELRSELPEVAVLQAPHRTEEMARFLEHAWIFDQIRKATAEDEQRSTMYAEQLARQRYAQQANSLREFLAGLQLDVVFAPVGPETLGRAAQLTQRTNQMNTSLARYSEGELAALLGGGAEAFTVTVRDRFGSYGVVGLVVMREEADALVVATFLLSCRALGRGVEQRMLSHAAEIGRAQGKRRLRMEMTRGPRNQPAQQLMAAAKQEPIGWTGDRARVEFDIAEVESLAGVEQAALPFAAPPAAETRRADEKAGQIDYQLIAGSLQSASAVLDAMQARRREAAARDRRVVNPPETEMQEKLAAIWCDLLAVREVGIDEDFFDLGGHSLMAVQLLSLIRERMGVELPDAVIYADKLRIDNLSRAIELQQLGATDLKAYEAILAEVESLSDDEVAALLAQEQEQA